MIKTDTSVSNLAAGRADIYPIILTILKS